MKTRKSPQAPHASSWREYNRSLCQRGAITVWFDPQATALFDKPKHDGSRGRPKAYGDDVTLAILTLKEVDHLPLRQTTGLLQSLVNVVGIKCKVPDFSTLARRRRTLTIPVRTSSVGPN